MCHTTNDMCGIELMTPRREGVTPRWGLDYSGDVRSQGVALGYRVNAPLARKNPRANHFPGVRKMVVIDDSIFRTNGAKPASPRQRPGKNVRNHSPALKGRSRIDENHFPDVRKMVTTSNPIFRTNGAEPISLGQRPRTNACEWISALKGRNPYTTDHFVGVNKMVPAYPSGSPETLNNAARELEARSAENVVELFEA